MTWHSVILDANAIICMAIVVRLMFFSKAGKTHRPSYAWMAYLLILAAGFTAFRILLGVTVTLTRVSYSSTWPYVLLSGVPKAIWQKS